MHNLAITLSATLLLAGCAAQAPSAPSATAIQTAAPASSPTVPSDPLSGLAAFTVADLQAASADAKAQTPPDVTAAQCYDYLAATIPTIKAPGANGTVGAVLLFQKTRDLANGATSVNGALKNLNLACAPLVIDVQTVVNKLLLIGAGTAATGGALAPFAGGLSAIGVALPIPLLP